MKRGFILTESEKKRIKGLYTIVLEQEEYKLDTPEKVGEFQTWLDGQYPDGWAKSFKTGKMYVVDGKPNRGFQRYGKNTQIMWNNSSVKSRYLESIGESGDEDESTTETTTASETKITKVTGDLGGTTPPPPTITTTTAPTITTTTSSTTNTSVENKDPYKIKRPDFKTNILSHENKFGKDIEGFNKWYSKIYKNTAPKSGLTVDGGSAEIENGDKIIKFIYDDDTNYWNKVGESKKRTKVKGLSSLLGLKGSTTDTTTLGSQ